MRPYIWVTGVMAFWISPIADNLTTAVLMGAVVSTLGQGEHEYLAMCCVNIVVAANAGAPSAPSETSPRSWYGRKASWL